MNDSIMDDIKRLIVVIQSLYIVINDDTRVDIRVSLEEVDNPKTMTKGYKVVYRYIKTTYPGNDDNDTLGYEDHYGPYSLTGALPLQYIPGLLLAMKDALYAVLPSRIQRVIDDDLDVTCRNYIDKGGHLK